MLIEYILLSPLLAIYFQIFIIFRTSSDFYLRYKKYQNTMGKTGTPVFLIAFSQTACDSCAGDQPEQSTTAQEKCDSREFAEIRGSFISCARRCSSSIYIWNLHLSEFISEQYPQQKTSLIHIFSYSRE